MKMSSNIIAVITILTSSVASQLTAGTTDKAKPMPYNARETVEAFLAAGLAGKTKVTATLSDPRTGIAEQAKTLQHQLRVAKLKVVSVHVSETGKRIAALAITESIQIRTPDPDGRDTGRLVLTLIKKTPSKKKEPWLVRDIDFETEESAKEELKRFLKKFPDAKLVQANPKKAPSDERKK